MRTYLAGPMQGYPSFNFPLFHRAARNLRLSGFEVVSPAEEDLLDGFDPDNPGDISRERYEEWMARDKYLISRCNAVCLLPGWEISEGARREKEHAEKLNKTVFYYLDWLEDKRWPADNPVAYLGDRAVNMSDAEARRIREHYERKYGV